MPSIDPQVLVTHLARFGWTPLPGTAIARKTYATAVGPKKAQVYLADYGAGCDNLVLQGQYYSEGRNALEARGVLLPRDASPELLAQLVANFAVQCDEAVAATYAARLLH